jgi:hypothetical protein
MMARSRRTETRALKWSNLWGIGGAVVVASLLTLISVGFLWLTRTAPGKAIRSTAILEITLAPTVTAAPATAVADPDKNLPTPPSGDIKVGAYVQVTGTGGSGLRMRDQPGLEGTVKILASDTEVFQVKDGPREVDGYIWWLLVGPFDETRQGWAVSNYLQIVEKP